MASPPRLDGKVAVVTGATGTMGRTTARAFLLQGAKVVLADIAEEKVGALAKSMCEECAVELSCAVGRRVDVTDEASVEKLFSELNALFGACNILVNCAGIMLPPTATEDLSLQAMSKVMDVNVTGTFLCAREAFKLMKSSAKGGCIINIGSLAAKASRPNALSYTTSKFAIAGLTQSLALDGRPHNIRVSVVHPGNMLSDLISPAEVAQRRAQGEDFMDPEVIADSIVHICALPENTTILDLTVLPTVQPFIGRG